MIEEASAAQRLLVHMSFRYLKALSIVFGSTHATGGIAPYVWSWTQRRFSSTAGLSLPEARFRYSDAAGSYGMS